MSDLSVVLNTMGCKSPGDALAFINGIDVLRSDEGSSVTFFCDNPDFNGLPNSKVLCHGAWTDWQLREFTGATVAEALGRALLANRDAGFSSESPGLEEESREQRRVRRCRECGIDHIEPGAEVDGEPLCWLDEDLCSHCQDRLDEQQRKDAERYRYLRDGKTWEGGHLLFAGRWQNGDMLSRTASALRGEELDHLVDAAMGVKGAVQEPLEHRLADCLAAIIDEPILEGRDEPGHFTSPLSIRLGFFKPELAERAAELLEEAGR